MLSIDRAKQLIEAGSFDEFDDILTDLITDKDVKLHQYFDIANELKTRGQSARACLMLELLGEHLEAQRDYRSAIEVQKALLHFHEESPPIRKKIVELYRRQHDGSQHLEDYLERSGLVTDGPIMKAIQRFDEYMTYDIGKCFYFERYGMGEVVAVIPEKREIVVDFEKKPKHFLPIDVARGLLSPIDEQHFLYAKRNDIERLRSMASSQPAETVIALLRSFNEPLTASQIKTQLEGVVEDDELSRFWEKVRKILEKHENVRVEGKTTKMYAYVGSTADKTRHAVEAFHKAGPNDRYRLAQDYASMMPAVFESLAPYLAELGRETQKDHAGLALDILMLLAETGHEVEPGYSIDDLLSSHTPGQILREMTNHQHRDRFLSAVKEKYPDQWAATATSMIFDAEDTRLLNVVIDHLDDMPSVQQDIYDRIITMPAQYPKHYHWMLRKIESGGLEAYLTPALVTRLIASLEHVPGVKTTARKILALERFDSVAVKAQSAEAQRIRNALKSSTVLSEHEKKSYLRILDYHFPELAEKKTGAIYSTRAALSKKKAELERLLVVDIPANKKEIGRAREYGDLSENFEYKAAKERQDQLYARVKALESELVNVKVIDPAIVATDCVSIGTAVKLQSTTDDSVVEYAILGRWDTDLPNKVISNEAPLAQSMLGKKNGDRMTIDGIEYVIVEIKRAL
ncbi:GreA/GreB family elongation factor [candidate division WOR-3 bacterium]|nr:GreA/GreB family elongation factor [candidate division WOR-3 bacterium]